MVYIRTRTFCCCLPVRFGVFILSILGVLAGGVLSIGAWMAVAHIASVPLSQQDTIALYISAVLFTLLGVVSVFGFIGACIRNASLVSLYGTMLVGHLIFGIIAGIFSIYSLFHQDASDLSSQCDNAAANDVTSQLCGNGMTTVKGIIIAGLVISWLIQLYACLIVYNYADQVDEEKAAEYLSQKDQMTRSNSTLVGSVHSGGRHKPPPLPIATTYNTYGGANYAAGQYVNDGHNMV